MFNLLKFRCLILFLLEYQFRNVVYDNNYVTHRLNYYVKFDCHIIKNITL